ncbi:MAG: hypothetical protein U9N30_05120 [Campylobacterota bacterium]|nr:hypothetical protein [Campylobacterota bacterium]
MQIFGKYETLHGIEYLVENYLYFPIDDQKLELEELEELLKKKRKTVAGTIFLYNPITAPVGLKLDKKLIDQDYSNFGNYEFLDVDSTLSTFESKIKNQQGKLVEIKYLFNFNKPNIQPTFALEEFNSDLERFYSDQATRFDRDLNYHDYKNIRLSGKFVFFAWGHKYDPHHPDIKLYAQNITQQAYKLGKSVAFVYDHTRTYDDIIEHAHFLHPIAFGKVRHKITDGFKEAFKSNPPVPVLV